MNEAKVATGQDLARVLGLLFGVAAVVGGAVGQGILRTPGIVAGAVGDTALILILWTLGGAVAAISAVAYAELGTALPRAGGPYVFVRRAFGRTPGIIIGWSDWLINISTQAFLAVVVAEFLHRLGIATAVPQAVLAPSLIALFLMLNWTNTRLCGSAQSIGSALKGAGLLLLVVVLFLASIGTTDFSPRSPPQSEPGIVGALAIIVALRAIQSTYDGWNNCIYFSEELQRPERCVPRSLFGGIAIVTMLYVLVNAALLQVLTPEAMAGSNLPAADALSQVIGGWAGVLLTLFGVVSVGAILNLNVMFGPRIALAMARDNVLPRSLAQVAPGGSPRAALVVTATLAMIFAASGTYEQLLSMNVALGALVNLTVSLSALRLRRTEPKLERPWKTPLFPLPILLAASINFTLLTALIYDDPVHSLSGTGIAVAIGLLYAASAKLRRFAVLPA